MVSAAGAVESLVAMVHRVDGRLPGDERHRRLRVHRPREQEPLPEVAPELSQSVGLLGNLDALGDDLERQRRAQSDDRGGEAADAGRGAVA